MGKKAHKSMPWMCGACKKGFGSEAAATDHAIHAHPSASGIGIYRCHKRVDGVDYDDSPSLADLAVNAIIDRHMGVPNDDDWLIP